MTEVPIEIIALSKQKPTTIINAKMFLCDRKMRVLMEFFCEEYDDEKGIWENDIYRCQDTTISRDKITGIRKFFTDKEYWKLTIFVASGHEVDLYADNEERINLIYTMLDYWLYEEIKI